MKKLTYTMFALTLFIVFTIVFSPLSNSSSSNPCSCSTHPSYYQYLNIVVGDSNNQIPPNINVNDTKTVAITIQNDVPNYPRYTTISNVYVTLSSAFGHFSGGSSTFVGDLTPGTKTVSWQITGTSDGYDFLQIQVSGFNPHRNIQFQDGYSPLISVGQPTGPTPTPLPTPTPAPTLPPIINPSTGKTPQPSISSTLQPTPTSNQSGQIQGQLEIQLLSPTQSVNWLPQTNHTIEWTCYGGKAPLNVTLEYSFSGGDDTWKTIATNLPANISMTWITPKGSSGDYYVRANVKDSATSVQTASATVQVLTETENSGSPILPVAAAVAATIFVLAVIIIMKRMKAGKTKN